VKAIADIAVLFIAFVDDAFSTFIAFVIPYYTAIDAFVAFLACFIGLVVCEALLVKKGFVAFNTGKR
jgi:hypothetical protein